MEYSSFRVQNFKGIDQLEIQLTGSPSGPIFTLVGLNESGKTTVLEAIGYFEANEEHLEHLYKQEFRHADVHDLIPMKKKANFNDAIRISATLILSSSDKQEISRFARDTISYAIDPSSISNTITITNELRFSDSNYKGTNNLWALTLRGIPKHGRKKRNLIDFDKNKWLKVIGFIRDKLPTILYFPTFLFEFPSRIYLQPSSDETSSNIYYREIIQDILDSLNDDLDTQKHIVERALDGSYVNRRNLDSVLTKMGNVVTKTIFERWNEVFDRRIPRKDIVVTYDIEDAGAESIPKIYLQLIIKDGDSLYLISERSLGFRWFFCFLLFTQFRQHREPTVNTLFLFDEPASNLHSKAQTQLIRSFSRITESTGKIIYSTHSHYMINPSWLENAYIVYNKGLRYEDLEDDYDYSSRNTDIRLERYRTFVGKNPDKITFYQPILDTLDYAPSNLEFVPNSVFLEGKNDYYLIRYFSQTTIGFIPGIGASGLDTLIALYLGWGRNFIILLDADKEGKKNKKRYIQDWFLNENQVFTLEDIDSTWSGLSSHQLIDKTDLHDLRAMCLPSSKRALTKKQIVRAVQELLLVGKPWKAADSTTVANFQKLVDFCAKKLK